MIKLHWFVPDAEGARLFHLKFEHFVLESVMKNL